MPELPEVQTTVDGVNKYTKNLRITDVWTSYDSDFHRGKDNIQNPAFFKKFKDLVVGAKIEMASRRAKNVLIHLDNHHTILIHMKMTGHLLYGKYRKRSKYKGQDAGWEAIESGPLRDDPFNRHVRLVFSLSDGRHLALSDMRKFAKVTIIKDSDFHSSKHIASSGPEPLDKSFGIEQFRERLLTRPRGKIKQVLMNHEVISGIGNIYSDEILWISGIHPLSIVKSIPRRFFPVMFCATRETLSHGIDFGGDSMSDYRDILGKKGDLQNRHQAYQRDGEKCQRKKCRGIIKKIKLGGRSAHFCDKHQKLFT